MYSYKKNPWCINNCGALQLPQHCKRYICEYAVSSYHKIKLQQSQAKEILALDRSSTSGMIRNPPVTSGCHRRLSDRQSNFRAPIAMEIEDKNLS